MIVQYFSFVLIYTVLWNVGAQTNRPNIIFLLADDMGWNDVSFHGSPQIPTPNIDALAASGLILQKYYAAPQCTPSRASLMTGKYTTNTGLQHYVIRASEPTGLPLQFTTMPQHFKKLGYATHMVGKWHLGYYKKQYTPPYRGFDSFFGYWNGGMDYYDFTSYETTSIPGINSMWGIDIHNNTEIVRGLQGNYSMDIFTKKAVEVIGQHNQSQPLFLYFSSQACHVGNLYQSLQAPPERVARFKYINDKNRRTYAGVVSSFDDAVGEIFKKLDSKGMLKNSVVAFASDNGGEAAGEHGGQASNWPLRGMKLYLWEGGVRVPAALWSPLLKLKEPRTAMQMMHVSDWLPTLYKVAGGNLKDLGQIDGKNMWETLMNNSPSPRKEIILNIDPFFGMSALIQGKYKIVNGSYTEGKNYWYGPDGLQDVNPSSLDAWVWNNGSVVKSIVEKNGWWLLKTPDTWRENATVRCGKQKRYSHGNGGCSPTRRPCLFDIEKDPCEYHNIAYSNQKIVKSMMKRIKYFNKTGYDSIATTMDSHADPRCYNFEYVPWKDEEYSSNCPWIE